VRHKKQTSMTGVISAGAYGSLHLKRGIHWLKFKGVRDIAPLLAAFVVPYLPMIVPLNRLQQEAVIIPIPLHKRRERQRGFNQSHDIASALSEQTGIPVKDALIRQRATFAQAKLAPGELRQKNLKGAFALTLTNPNLHLGGVDWDRVRYLILLDDVTTTGSTLSAASDVLKAAGAKEVWGVTLARG